jgi:hypothetical protein
MTVESSVMQRDHDPNPETRNFRLVFELDGYYDIFFVISFVLSRSFLIVLLCLTCEIFIT